MLTKGEEYTDQGPDYYEERYRERVLYAQSQHAAQRSSRRRRAAARCSFDHKGSSPVL
jgi:hypothetical protein